MNINDGGAELSRPLKNILEAQAARRGGGYSGPLSEINAGRKSGHWIWSVPSTAQKPRYIEASVLSPRSSRRLIRVPQARYVHSGVPPQGLGPGFSLRKSDKKSKKKKYLATPWIFEFAQG